MNLPKTCDDDCCKSKDISVESSSEAVGTKASPNSIQEASTSNEVQAGIGEKTIEVIDTKESGESDSGSNCSCCD